MFESRIADSVVKPADAVACARRLTVIVFEALPCKHSISQVLMEMGSFHTLVARHHGQTFRVWWHHHGGSSFPYNVDYNIVSMMQDWGQPCPFFLEL